ncbi:MAG: hypothetical protein WCP69_16095 [Bacteroidota bacterium]
MKKNALSILLLILSFLSFSQNNTLVNSKIDTITEIDNLGYKNVKIIRNDTLIMKDFYYKNKKTSTSIYENLCEIKRIIYYKRSEKIKKIFYYKNHKLQLSEYFSKKGKLEKTVKSFELNCIDTTKFYQCFGYKNENSEPIFSLEIPSYCKLKIFQGSGGIVWYCYNDSLKEINEYDNQLYLFKIEEFDMTMEELFEKMNIRTNNGNISTISDDEIRIVVIYEMNTSGQKCKYYSYLVTKERHDNSKKVEKISKNFIYFSNGLKTYRIVSGGKGLNININDKILTTFRINNTTN